MIKGGGFDNRCLRSSLRFKESGVTIHFNIYCYGTCLQHISEHGQNLMLRR